MSLIGYKLRVILCLLCLFCSSLWANTEHLKQLSLEQGLSQAEVTSILQDNEGFIWLGTFQGLNIYDGYTVKKPPGPDNVLSSTQVTFLYQDRFNDIWVGSAPNGNYRINKENGTVTPISLPFPEGMEITDDAIRNIQALPGNEMLLSTIQALFHIDANNNISFYQDLSIDESELTFPRTFLNFDNYILVGTTNGLYKLLKDTREFIRINFLPHVNHINEQNNLDDRLNVKGLQVNQSGNLLILTVEGLYETSLSAISKTKNSIDIISKTLEPNFNIWQVIEKEDFYWLGTNEGLVKQDKQTPENKQRVLQFSQTKPNADNNIPHMMEDNEGNLWLASRNHGAFWWRPLTYVPKTFVKNANSNKGLSNNVIWSFKEDNNQNLWIGTDNGINFVENETGHVTQFYVDKDTKSRWGEANVIDIETNNDQSWVLTQIGIKRFNIDNKKEIHELLPEEVNELFSQPGYDIHFANENKLFHFSPNGVYQYELDKKELTRLELTYGPNDFEKQLIRVLGEHPNDPDKLFVSMLNKVVTLSKSTHKIETFHQLPEDNRNKIDPQGILVDGDKMWISYPGFGIHIIDIKTGERVKHLTSSDGLPDNSMFQMLKDADNFVWVTSNSGLTRINSETFHIRVYDTSNGLLSNEFNGGTASFAKNGDLLLGGIHGAMRISPSEFRKQNQLKKNHNHIVDITLMSRAIPERFSAYYDHELELAHDDYGLSMEFSALLYSKTQGIQYKYWIDGATKTPATIISSNHLLLPKLSTGKSIINVSNIDIETGEESPAETLTVVVKPIPYLAWQALAFYGVVVLAVVFYIYSQKRQRQLQLLQAHQTLKTNEERLLLALKGSKSGLWDWRSDTNSIYETKLDDIHSGHNMSYQERLEQIHQDDRDEYHEKWLAFLARGNGLFEITYRYWANNSWLWFRDLASVSQQDESGSPTRITGTFSDITANKINQDKVSLFSNAFQNTRDLIVITDADLNIIDANKAFFASSDYNREKVIGHPPKFIVNSDESTDLLTKIVLNLMSKDHWEGEGILLCNSNSKIHVVINITKFTIGQDSRLVFALTDIRKQKEAEEGLKRLANYDVLTGLPNRALLNDRIIHAVEHSKRSGDMFAVCFIDLDNFKTINDSLGHDVGDELLVEVAGILRSTIRTSDTVARIGGDEFVILLEELDSLDPVHRIAQLIIDEMQQMNITYRYQATSSPSIGIATFPNDGKTATEIIKHADTAMYHAKQMGRNNFQFFQQSMNEDAHNKLILENEIKQAIASHKFFNLYQPKIDLETNKIMGVEALARWEKDDNQMVSPAVFIPVIEDLGMITVLTEQLLYKALTTLKHWHEQGHYITMAVNLSARHLQNYDLPGFIQGLLKQFNLNAKYLELELTEGVLMDDIDAGLNVCNQLAELGVNIALDDFGTGYSSFKYLSQLPINTLKIDRSFVWNMGDAQNDAVIGSILSLAKTLEIKTVAEGIETKQQLDFLTAQQCDYAQGFYFAKPLNEVAMLELLNECAEQKSNTVNL